MNALTALPILEKLGLRSKKPGQQPSAADIAGALDRAEKQREAAASSLAALAEERASMLLLADDGALDAIEQRQQAAARELDRLDAAIGELERRYEATVAAEQAAGRAKLVQQHSAAARAAVSKLHDALLAAEAAADDLRGVIAESQVDGVPACAPADLRFTRRLTATDISEWHVNATRLLNPPAPLPRDPHAGLIRVRFTRAHRDFAAGAEAWLTPESAEHVIGGGVAALVDTAGAERLPKPHRIETPKPDSEGTVEVVFTGNVLTYANNFTPGDTRRLSPDEAAKLVRSGVAQFVEGRRDAA